MEWYVDSSAELALMLRNPQGIIHAGDTVYLRDGTYTGDFVCAASGVMFQANPGERPVINGSLTINGNYTLWDGIEICWMGWPKRTSEQADWSDMDLTKKLTVYGVGTKIRHCVLHDLVEVDWWEQSTDSEFYGNVIINTGFQEVNLSGYGHSMYSHNNTGRKAIKHNIMHSPFNWNLHLYAETGHVNNYDIIENVFVNGGKQIAGGATDGIIIGPTQNIAIGNILTRNMTYNNRYGLIEGGGVGFSDLIATENYFPDGWSINTDHLDPSSSGNTTSPPSSGVQTFLYADDYDSDKAYLVVYNWDLSNGVSVDVSSVFNVGDSINARNVQDYFTDIQNLTVAGDGTITVDMQAVNRSVVAPVQWSAPATTFPDFGCFVLERA